MSDKDDVRREGGAAVESRPQTKKPRMYAVVVHNDDYTTMEFVVEVLQTFFHKNHTEAMQLMLYVHTKGKAVAGVYTRDLAETKVEQVHKYARQNGHPLLLTVEPA